MIKEKTLQALKALHLLSFMLLISCLPKAVINSPVTDTTPTVETTPKATAVPSITSTTPNQETATLIVSETFDSVTPSRFDFSGNVTLTFFSQTSSAGTKIIDYGFEDWTGFNGTNSPAPNYIFSTAYDNYWQDHMNGTSVMTSCNSATAYEGNHFFHNQFYTGSIDACLGTTPSSINAHSSLGVGNLNYPTGTKNSTQLQTAITSNTMVMRLYMRCTGNWSSTQPSALDESGGLKFIRVYGGDGAGDDSSALLKLLNDGDSADPSFGFYDPGNLDQSNFSVGVNWQDGNWHPVALKVVRNADDNSSNNVTMTVWVDDWNMNGFGVSRTITVPDMGSKFDHISLMENWSGKAATAGIAIDIDKIEVWDGIPTSELPATTENYQDEATGYSLKVDYGNYTAVPSNSISLTSVEYGTEFYFTYLYKYDEAYDLRYGWKPFRMQTPLTDSGSYALFFNDNASGIISSMSLNFSPGNNWKTPPPQTKGVWHKFELYYKQNTPNVADGVFVLQIDGITVMNETAFLFLNANETFTTFMLPSNGSNSAGIVYIDNIEIWKSRPY